MKKKNAILTQLLLLIVMACFLAGSVEARNPWDDEEFPPGRSTDSIPPKGGGKGLDSSQPDYQPVPGYTFQRLLFDMSYSVAEILDIDWTASQNEPNRAEIKK